MADEESFKGESGARRLVAGYMGNAKGGAAAGPRDCCLVSPETVHEHGHPLDDTDLAGTDDALAEAAFKRGSREKGNTSG